MHPFDLRAASLEKHAQHVVLIHFPIALFFAGAAFDMAAQWSKQQVLAAAARYNLTVAAAFSLPVLVSGLLAWRWQFEGQRLKGILLEHLILGFVSSALIWLVWWLHFRAGRNATHTLPVYRLSLELIAMLAVGLTAHLGGFLSGVNGPG